jgi:predicted HAD superfamily phosphohydrolase
LTSVNYLFRLLACTYFGIPVSQAYGLEIDLDDVLEHNGLRRDLL